MIKLFIHVLVLIAGLCASILAFSQVTSVESVGITVNDMDRSVDFYTNVLGFTKIDDSEHSGDGVEKLKGLFGINIRVVKLQLGDEVIELTDYLTVGGRSIPESHKSNDLFFQHIAIVVSNMDSAYKHLRKFKVDHVSTMPQTLPRSIPAAEGIKAFYFRDPDQHNLELIYFPPGKGQQKWQARSEKVFLGIDHTAIGVSSTDKSHHFYSKILGIDRKGDSWNKGKEQEHLNNIEGASLHITGYRTSDGPGLEFLEYIIPGPGKQYPPDSRPDDLWHWQTNLIVDDAEALYKLFRDSKSIMVSRGLIQQEIHGIVTKSFLVRDPDGHAVLIKEYLNP